MSEPIELTDWLDETERLDSAATPGPWEEDGSLIGPRPGASVAQAWGVRWRADAEWIAHARTALPAATAAIRAVTDLHQPFRHKGSEGHLCVECGRDATEEATIPWPCPTIQAMTEAIEKGDPHVGTRPGPH